MSLYIVILNLYYIYMYFVQWKHFEFKYM